MHQLDDAGRLRILTTILGAQAQRIDSIELLKDGAQLYETQLAAIRAAKHSVHLESYIFHPGRWADAFLDALKERAGASVYVRVMIDAIGSLRTPKSHFADLRAAGGRVYRYHPLHWRMLLRWNSRTHRNLLVLDGQVAFVGGAGIADHGGAERNLHRGVTAASA